MTPKLDHIMYATSDLALGITEVEALTGVRAVFGGSHSGAGTCNALMSFGQDQYLEIIAPDKEQKLQGTMGEELKRRPKSGIRTFAVAVDDYEPLGSVLDQFGFGSRKINMSRVRPDGVELAWQILFVTGHPFGLLMPFFINWLNSPHPSLDAPAGCELDSFNVRIEDAGEYARFCDAIGLAIVVDNGAASMNAMIKTPNGDVLLE